MNWEAILRALVLVKIGQELGCEGRLALFVHEAINAILSVVTVALR